MKGLHYLLAGVAALAFACATSDEEITPEDAGTPDAGDERGVRRPDTGTPDALPDAGSDAPLDGLGCRALPVPDDDAGEDCLPFESDMCEPCMQTNFAYLCKYGTSPKLPDCGRPPFDQGAADADSIFACCPTLKCMHYSFDDGLYCGATGQAFVCLDGGSLPDACEYQDASGVFCCPGSSDQ